MGGMSVSRGHMYGAIIEGVLYGASTYLRHHQGGFADKGHEQGSTPRCS